MGCLGEANGEHFEHFWDAKKEAKLERIFERIFEDSWSGSAVTAVAARGLFFVMPKAVNIEFLQLIFF